MPSKEWIIEKYETIKGRVPYDEWFEDLDENTQARIDARLDRVSLGNLGDCKNVGNGVHELRLFFGPGYRIYFGQFQNRIILLLCGGDKSTQSRDIKKAQILWQKFLKEKQ